MKKVYLSSPNFPPLPFFNTLVLTFNFPTPAPPQLTPFLIFQEESERERRRKDEEPNVMKNSFFQRKNKDEEVLFSG
jgi:hypothetical protein